MKTKKRRYMEKMEKEYITVIFSGGGGQVDASFVAASREKAIEKAKNILRGRSIGEIELFELVMVVKEKEVR